MIMRPHEGIDKISIILNPLFLVDDWKDIFFDPYRKLTMHRAGIFTTLVIHQEYFNPFLDYQMQISLAIYELIKKGIIDFPDTPFTPYFIYKNHSWFIINIVANEFYFDVEKEEVIINEDMVERNIDAAKENNCLYQYIDKVTKEPTDTYYSSDKATNKYDRSSLIIYNKQAKDIKDNQIKREHINIIKPIRIEFRLYSDNTPWLNWDNLKGDYNDIFNRHIDLLAVMYNQYANGCITVNTKNNPNLKKVIKKAEVQNPIRYSGNRLKKHIPISKIKEYDKDRSDVKRDEGLKKLDRFSNRNRNLEECQNMVKMMSQSKENK